MPKKSKKSVDGETDREPPAAARPPAAAETAAEPVDEPLAKAPASPVASGGSNPLVEFVFGAVERLIRKGASKQLNQVPAPRRACAARVRRARARAGRLVLFANLGVVLTPHNARRRAQSDLPPLAPANSATICYDRFEKLWEAEQRKPNPKYCARARVGRCSRWWRTDALTFSRQGAPSSSNRSRASARRWR